MMFSNGFAVESHRRSAMVRLTCAQSSRAWSAQPAVRGRVRSHHALMPALYAASRMACTFANGRTADVLCPISPDASLFCSAELCCALIAVNLPQTGGSGIGAGPVEQMTMGRLHNAITRRLPQRSTEINKWASSAGAVSFVEEAMRLFTAGMCDEDAAADHIIANFFTILNGDFSHSSLCILQAWCHMMGSTHSCSCCSCTACYHQSVACSMITASNPSSQVRAETLPS